jgi:hypothetical protein
MVLWLGTEQSGIHRSSVRKVMTDLSAEGAAAVDEQSSQDIVTHGIGFACRIIYAMSTVIIDGQCHST